MISPPQQPVPIAGASCAPRSRPVRGRERAGARRPAARLRAQAGMTLIEMLVMLAVISLMMGMVLYSASSGRAAETSRATNQLANTIRFGFNKARTTGTYYRLNINIDDKSFALQAADEAMYMPATNRNGEPVVLDASKLEDRAARDKRAEEQYNRSIVAKVMETNDDDEGGELDPYAAGPRTVPRRKPPVYAAFQDENTLSELQKPLKLPDGVEIVSIRTEHDIKPATTGETNLFFFPQGRTQKAHIQLRRKGAEEGDPENQGAFTIIVHPLTGRVDIKPGLVELEVPRDSYDEEDDTGRRRSRRAF